MATEPRPRNERGLASRTGDAGRPSEEPPRSTDAGRPSEEPPRSTDAERARLDSARAADNPWRLWGPFLSERQWGTVREDYSGDFDPWRSFPHDHARSRAYRWGEDGLLGITDRECRLCFSVALWNGRDPILKERLFGLTNPEGNHGEDVKELYYYVAATPTASYLRALYKYPLAAFPYAELVEGNRARGHHDPELELMDTSAFARGYVDVTVEYAKNTETDVFVRITLEHRGDEPATVHVLPTLWFRNTWGWGDGYEARFGTPRIVRADDRLVATHATLGTYELSCDDGDARGAAEYLFTENETNYARLFGVPNPTPHVKDAFHDAIVRGERHAVSPRPEGTKAARHLRVDLRPGERRVFWLRLREADPKTPEAFDRGLAENVFAARITECEAFYAAFDSGLSTEERRVFRQACAGLIWTQQFYYYDLRTWLRGDPAHPPPPPSHALHENREWPHFFARDVLSMPDKWEFPWFAVWDTAFHMIPFGDIDPALAKSQLLRFLRDWYQHPSGQLPAYEFNLGDVNPPVHAWACRHVYERDGRRDRVFLRRAFHKLALNFTWWVNRKDPSGRNLFAGGFLGLDNIGVFDRSKALPSGSYLEQADGTAWMAFFCGEMLAIALELAKDDPSYEDMASKFLEHYVAITEAINTLDGTGLWDEEHGFYYDHLHFADRTVALRVRSMVGIIPLFAVELIDRDALEKLPNFRRRLGWLARHRADVLGHLELPAEGAPLDKPHYLLTLPSRARLERLLARVFDEAEFLSPFGVRSLSKAHATAPFVCHAGNEEHVVGYVPGEADSGLFGGNSNWRGPVWFPVNYLLIESLRRYAAYYGDALTVELPKGSGRRVPLDVAADELATRLVRLFLPEHEGRRPCHGDANVYAEDPAFRDLVLFYEYFHGETGRGCGASHQTGWTALVASLLRNRRSRAKAGATGDTQTRAAKPVSGG